MIALASVACNDPACCMFQVQREGAAWQGARAVGPVGVKRGGADLCGPVAVMGWDRWGWDELTFLARGEPREE